MTAPAARVRTVLARAAGRRGAVPVTYLLLALLGHLPAFSSLATRTQCPCKDAPQTDWFLGWTPHALLGGRTPWTTDVLDVPAGVNLMWNTLLPLPGLLAAPVTATWGPLASHTLLAVLAFAGSATTMWWAAGRWAPWRPARFAAGLLYGFSPYLVAQGTGHLNLSLVAVPPLVLLALDELLVRQGRRAVVAGAGLGALALVQLMTTEEVLASTFVLCLAGLAVLAVQQRAALTRGRVRHAAVGLAVAAGVLGAGAAWPLSVQFLGPQRVTAPVQDASPYSADLLGLAVPTVHQLFGTAATLSWAGNDSENGSYLGLPLLAALVVLVVRHRRVAVVRFAAALGAVAWVLSLGDRLHVGGRSLPVPLPFAVVRALPVLYNMAAVRLSLYVVLCAALVLAVGLDRLHATGTRAGWLAAGALLCGLPLLPAWPYRYVEARTPAYFTSAAVEQVPRGSVALTYPVPRFPLSAPMTWQALAGFRYRSPGGYLIVPQPDGSGTFGGGVTAWERVVSRATPGHPVPLPGPVRQRLRQELQDLQVRSVLVAPGPASAEVAGLVVALLERDPDTVQGGVSAWYDVGRPIGP